MKMKSFLAALTLLPALVAPVLADDRYREAPFVLIDPVLYAPWVRQLNGASAHTAAPVTVVPPERGSTWRGKPVARHESPRGQAWQPPPSPPRIALRFLPQAIDYKTAEPSGTIVIDTPNRFLYLVTGNGRARRYGVGVGKPGFEWAGVHRVSRKTPWPDWRPPKEMIAREAAKGRQLPTFMAGGQTNPMGARALYLGSTLYRIHGTNEPWTIGSNTSSGCIRMRNEDVIDLYDRVKIGTRVIVL